MIHTQNILKKDVDEMARPKKEVDPNAPPKEPKKVDPYSDLATALKKMSKAKADYTNARAKVKELAAATGFNFSDEEA